MYDIENYYNAETIKEAVTLLKEHPEARIISGGSDVLIKIREGKLAGTSLVCIRDIKELKGIIKMDSGDIYICNGAVSADSAPALFSLNAMVRTADGSGGRTVPIHDFYLGPGKVDVKPGELVTHILIPEKEYTGYHGHYIKYSMRRAMDIATLGCCVVSRINPSTNILEDIRITFGVAAPVPLRCVNTEEALKGSPVNEKLYQAIEDKVREEIHPRDSWRASREFRLQIGGEIARRALERTVELAAGGERK